ncbi:MAG: PAS domain S-box protein, partial [Alphaproteobacteria bacterium]|nr:PAS domain S-box protein [Alphaproteobacteria bacterium]
MSRTNVKRKVAVPAAAAAGKQSGSDAAAILEVFSRSQAIIEFAPDGTILTANQNFLSTLGYGLEEVQGRHHSMFVEPAQVSSPEYREFWLKLARGEYQART